MAQGTISTSTSTLHFENAFFNSWYLSCNLSVALSVNLLVIMFVQLFVSRQCSRYVSVNYTIFCYPSVAHMYSSCINFLHNTPIYGIHTVLYQQPLLSFLQIFTSTGVCLFCRILSFKMQMAGYKLFICHIMFGCHRNTLYPPPFYMFSSCIFVVFVFGSKFMSSNYTMLWYMWK